MSDEPATTCEVCGAKASRVLFAPAIHFKGSGFHNTDYGSKRRGNGGDDGGGGSTDSGGNGSGTSDSGTSSGTSDSGTATTKSSESSGGSSKTVGLDKA